MAVHYVDTPSLLFAKGHYGYTFAQCTPFSRLSRLLNSTMLLHSVFLSLSDMKLLQSSQRRDLNPVLAPASSPPMPHASNLDE